MAIAGYAGLVTQSLRKGLTQADPHIFHRVMAVNLEIALRLQTEVEKTMHCQQAEHVFHEAQPAGHVGPPTAVKEQIEMDSGFQGVPLDAGLSSL